MNLSDDEDFLSADEDGFDDDKKTVSTIHQNVVPDLNKQVDPFEDEVHKYNCKIQPTNKVIESVEDKPTIVENKVNSKSVKQVQKESTKVGATNVPGEDDEDEEALAERIRERNLKIARKFSAEITKNIKVSAPIPVKSGAPIGFKVNDIEYPNIAESDNASSPPPAPPPTPALSSSFNSADDPSGSPSVGGSQYGWRVPAKMRLSTAETSTPPDAMKSEQARQALDRLSEKLSQSDKNLFEKVAEDIKKVSIKPGDPVVSEQSQPSSSGGSAGILISDLGSALGGWSWNSASRLLASASQVTSQVGSVLDSVVNASQHPTQQQSSQQQEGTSQASGTSQLNQSTKQTSEPQDKQSDRKSSSASASMSANEAVSNDALVDFTLNAMESLGKKAFDVMTERDESGSLQIKGIGRPWEHILNMKKQPSPTEQRKKSSPPGDDDKLD